MKSCSGPNCIPTIRNPLFDAVWMVFPISLYHILILKNFLETSSSSWKDRSLISDTFLPYLQPALRRPESSSKTLLITTHSEAWNAPRQKTPLEFRDSGQTTPVH